MSLLFSPLLDGGAGVPMRLVNAGKDLVGEPYRDSDENDPITAAHRPILVVMSRPVAVGGFIVVILLTMCGGLQGGSQGTGRDAGRDSAKPSSDAANDAAPDAPLECPISCPPVDQDAAPTFTCPAGESCYTPNPGGGGCPSQDCCQRPDGAIHNCHRF
jgi:hypothetical protein